MGESQGIAGIQEMEEDGGAFLPLPKGLGLVYNTVGSPGLARSPGGMTPFPGDRGLLFVRSFITPP